MAKISPVNRKAFTKIIKQKRNLMMMQKATKSQPKAIEAKVEQAPVTVPDAQDLAFDSYLKATARDMLKGMTRVELTVSKPSAEINNFYNLSSENSIWAPWTKLFNHRK